jgi:hypothetical protein
MCIESYDLRDLLEKKKKRLKIQYVVRMTDLFIFRMLKINHVSHEFILEFGTVANRNMQIIFSNTYICICSFKKISEYLYNATLCINLTIYDFFIQFNLF